MDFLIPLLGGALGAAVINGAVAFFKLRSDRNIEHEQWRRDRRQEGYSQHFADIAALKTALERFRSKVTSGDAGWGEVADSYKTYINNQYGMYIVAPQAVVGASGDLKKALIQLMDETAKHDNSDAGTRSWEQVAKNVEAKLISLIVLVRKDLDTQTDDATLAKMRAHMAKQPARPSK